MLISTLGKLYITSNSSTEKLQLVSNLVMEAVDSRVAVDMPSKNALAKLQTALSKAIGDTGVEQRSPTSEDMTVMEEGEAEAPAQMSGGETRMEDVIKEEKMEMQDSVLEELLNEEEEL